MLTEAEVIGVAQAAWRAAHALRDDYARTEAESWLAAPRYREPELADLCARLAAYFDDTVA
ncbi:hypothetical protein [Amycolatopsis anabasis]|uniref:hypothetical protein n=1 Tax=Amycolatopsis anabasis TaxID=1840409 RepID=UPI00131AB6F3|nr:hypothetical protein [Amycolatopsis anabasis]